MSNIQMSNIERYVYKFVKKTSWDDFIKSGNKEFYGIDNDIRDGFIHMCFHKDLYTTFSKYYKEEEKKDFKLLTIDTKKVKDIRLEKAKNGIIYPHAYCGLVQGESIIWIIDMDDYKFNIDGL